jgi:hypothetical protein
VQVYGAEGWRPRQRARNIERHKEYFDKYMPSAKAAYQLGIRDVDDMLAEFFDALKGQDLFDDTTIILFGDHGEEFFAHGLLTHTSLYQENLNVPLVMKLAESSPYCRLLDGAPKVNPFHFEAHTTLFKVVLDLFDVPYPRYLKESKVNALGLAQLLALSANEEVFAEMYMRPRSPFYEASLIDESGRQLIFSTDLTRGYGWQISNPYTQLYDLNTDPQNQHDLFRRSGDAGLELQARTVQKALGVRECQFRPGGGRQLRKDEVEILRDLGYVN